MLVAGCGKAEGGCHCRADKPPEPVNEEFGQDYRRGSPTLGQLAKAASIVP